MYVLMIVVVSVFKQPPRPQILNLNLERKKIDYFVFKGHAFSEKYVPGHNL